jgi:hypothetical protein
MIAGGQFQAIKEMINTCCLDNDIGSKTTGDGDSGNETAANVVLRRFGSESVTKLLQK